MISSRQRGFTLFEVLVFITVVLFGIVGILSVMNRVVASSADPMLRKQTLAIAESLMEEILLKEFAKPAGSTVVGATSGSRTQFDCVSDFNGYTTSGGMVDWQGAPIPSLSRYNLVQGNGGPGVVVTATTIGGAALLMVTVSVTGPAGTISLTGYRGNY
jgi:MSHA pilin protein MshD